jgi:hypothetical protein
VSTGQIRKFHPCIEKGIQANRFSGFFWEGGMTGAEELCILASWDDAQLSLEEVEGHVESLNKIVQWIIEPDNWSKPVGEILGAKSK